MTESKPAFTLVLLLSIGLVLYFSILAKLLAFNVLLYVKCSVTRPNDPEGECLLKFCTPTSSLISPQSQPFSVRYLVFNKFYLMAQTVKNLPAGDLGLIPGLGRSPGERKGYPLQYSGLENSMDCIIHGVTNGRTRLNNFHFHRFAINILPRSKCLLISCGAHENKICHYFHVFPFYLP